MRVYVSGALHTAKQASYYVRSVRMFCLNMVCECKWQQQASGSRLNAKAAGWYSACLQHPWQQLCCLGPLPASLTLGSQPSGLLTKGWGPVTGRNHYDNPSLIYSVCVWYCIIRSQWPFNFLLFLTSFYAHWKSNVSTNVPTIFLRRVKNKLWSTG